MPTSPVPPRSCSTRADQIRERSRWTPGLSENEGRLGQEGRPDAGVRGRPAGTLIGQHASPSARGTKDDIGWRRRPSRARCSPRPTPSSARSGGFRHAHSSPPTGEVRVT